MRSKVYEEIGHIADRIRGVNGTIGVILFGSYSRGDFEEGSDIDLLVIFRNKKELQDHIKEVYKITSESSLFVQVIGLTLKELMSSPLLQPVLREGKICFADEDVKRTLTPMHEPYALITYTTTNLVPKQRVILAQKLEGRGRGKYNYDGLIQKLNGFKIGRGVLMVPLRNLRSLVDCLEQERVDYVTRYVWA